MTKFCTECGVVITPLNRSWMNPIQLCCDCDDYTQDLAEDEYQEEGSNQERP